MHTQESSHEILCRYKDPSLGSSSTMYECQGKCALPIDFQVLLAFVRQKHPDDTQTIKDGKKRSASASSPGRSKRAKIADDVSTENDHSTIPVYRHTFDLRFTTRTVPAGSGTSYTDGIRALSPAETEKAQNIEAELLNVLRAHYNGPTQDITIDLGDFNARNLPCYASREPPFGLWSPSLNRHLCILPREPVSIDTSSYDVALLRGDLFSFVNAMPCLPLPRASLSATASLVVKPVTSWDPSSDDMPFRLVVDVDMAFHTPAIFEPLAGNRLANEARRALLHFAFPSPTPDSFHGRVDIPFFYASVHPAPQLSSDKAHEATQPDALLPTLLPFQRRTVAWMLDREGKVLEPSSGTVIERPMDFTNLPLFWERVTVKPKVGPETVWYYRRLTGDLTAEFPDAELECLGGSVCGL